MQLKEGLNSVTGLPKENPGSMWPKTTFGCLRDGRRLTPEQLATLLELCRCEGLLL